MTLREPLVLRRKSWKQLLSWSTWKWKKSLGECNNSTEREFIHAEIEQQKICDTEYQIKARRIKAEPTQVHKEQKMSHSLSKTTRWSQDAYASGIAIERREASV